MVMQAMAARPAQIGINFTPKGASELSNISGPKRASKAQATPKPSDMNARAHRHHSLAFPMPTMSSTVIIRTKRVAKACIKRP